MIEATDLDRATNTGRIFNLHRATLAEPGAIVTDDEAEQMMAAEACTELGAEPVGRSGRLWLAIKNLF